ncbi:DUF6907 domain-containing protein [Streptomyces sp. NPDC098789]|uniref:DUF6907 domain-containing protein n=1 Tax=Streptomyces sp. NPDC098789 TaxID=3366098 RepID=UPI003829F674
METIRPQAASQMPPKTYTGPTLGGAVATIRCPDWCVVDHGYWDDNADDCYHKGDVLELALPRDRANYPAPVPVPVLAAELNLHSTAPGPAAANVWLHLSEFKDDGLELDLAGVDQLLANVDRYRDGLAVLRGRLAAIDAERRRRY